MPTNRTPLRRRRKATITPEALALWRDCREIIAAGTHMDWEDAGGRRREFLTKHREIHLALGIYWWSPSPVDDAEDASPPIHYRRDPLRLAGWRAARKLRGDLLAAAAKGIENADK